MRLAIAPPVLSCAVSKVSRRWARPCVEYALVGFVNSAFTSPSDVVRAVESLAVSSVSLPDTASLLIVPLATAAPVERPTCESDLAESGLPLKRSATEVRSDESRPVSDASPASTPLARSLAFFGLATFRSSIFDWTKSIVELYWSTNDWILLWIAEVLGAGAPTLIVTAEEVTALSTSWTPGRASATVFVLDVLSTPSTL